MNKTNIEWCDYTWNPVIGCRNQCPKCWAARFNNRFKMIPDFHSPKFFPERLIDPSKVTTPSKIAVALMGDLFSPGVKDEWINRILFTCRQNNHIFMLLTKFPARFYEFEIPDNCWIGTSVSSAKDKNRIEILVDMGCKYTSFVSVEPLLGSMEGADLHCIDFVFVGAQTGPGAVAPEKDWINSIQHPNILYKENIKRFL